MTPLLSVLLIHMSKTMTPQLLKTHLRKADSLAQRITGLPEHGTGVLQTVHQLVFI
jgi:hypothetical protein